MKNRILAILDTKSKKIVAVVLVIAILGISVSGVYAMLQKDIKLTLKNETFTSEYGEVISLEAKDYLDLNKLSEKEKEDVLKNIKVEAPGIVKEEGKEYPVLGQTMLTLIYKEEKINAKVFVNDTKAPVFNEITEVTFEQGTEFDYATTIVATDLQEVTVEFDTSNVNKDISGEYIVKAVAKDKSNNEATKDIKVIITPKVVEETPTTSDGNASNGANSKPSSNGTTSSGGSSNSGSTNKPSTGGSNNGGTPPPTKPEAPHNHIFTPYANIWFNNGDELDAWARAYKGPNGDWASKTWGSSWCSCGKIGINIFENVKYWE